MGHEVWLSGLRISLGVMTKLTGRVVGNVKSRCITTAIVAGELRWYHERTALDYETRLLAGGC